MLTIIAATAASVSLRRADEKLTAFLELESTIRDCSIGSKLSLQRGPNFREEMGNGLRFRITQNDGHEPKTRKKIIL